MESLIQDIANSNLIASAVRNIPNPVLQEDEILNDSDKTFTVPATKIWQILYCYVELSTSAITGNRNLDILFTDSSDDVILNLNSFISQSEDCACNYIFGNGTPLNASEALDLVQVPLPSGLYLPAGYKIRIYDSAAIDPTHDDMIVHLIINQFDISGN